MEEMGDNARVWRVYNDEADRIDAEMVDGWKSTLDTLLIFAGLFSAVVATFVTQTSQNLQPNYSEVTASLLTELVSIQRTAATSGNVSAVNPSNLTHDTPFMPARRDVILNGLWFASLGLTLTTALLTGLVKQWLHFYVADVSGSAKERACTRQFRFTGLAAWGVSPIIEFLPVLMNASLLLFFAGLILFCQELSGAESITTVIITLTCISFVFYLGSSILSVLYAQCPYKSSLSTMFNFSYRILWHMLIYIFANSRYDREGIERTLSEDEDLSIHGFRFVINPFSLGLLESAIKRLYKLSSMRHAESKTISCQQLPLQLQAITAMVANSSNSTIPDIALQALAGLHMYTFSKSLLPNFLLERISETLWDWLPARSNPNSNYQLPVTPFVVERYSRALLCRSFPIYDERPILVFAARSDPADLRYLGLRALFNLKGQHFSSNTVGQNLDALMQHVHQLAPIEVHEVHPWIRTKLRQTMRLVQAGLQDEASTFSHLAQNLSLLKPLTLQEDLMLYRLEFTYAPSGFFNNEEEMQMQSVTRAQRADLTEGLIHTGFIFILPSLVRVALSTGEAEHGDSILGLMDEMFTTTKTDVLYPSWKMSPWDARLPHGLEEPTVGTAPFKAVLEQLLDILISTEDGPESGQLWEGNVPLRLNVIMRLHNTIYNHDEYHRSTLDAIFCWLLRLSTHERSDGELPSIDGIDQELASDLSSFFFGQFSKHQWQEGDPLVGLYNYLTSRPVLGLTKTMLEHLVETVYPPWRKPSSSWIDQGKITGLRSLFGYFVRRNSSNVDQQLPLTEEEQQNTLATIVQLACKGKATATDQTLYSSWNAMLTSWLALLREVSANRNLELEAVVIEQEGEAHLQPTRPGLDFAALIRLIEQAIEIPPKERSSISRPRYRSRRRTRMADWFPFTLLRK